MATSAKVIIRGVSKTYGHGSSSVVALEPIDLEQAAGDFTCLVGPSGCGKSTLLNILAGFTPPTTGSVVVAGRDVRRPGPDRGVVFQQGSLFTWMSVQDNIQFGPRCRGLGRAEARDVAQRYMKLVGLQKFAQRYPYELSGGMQQRVGIARALANEPDVLLMDEPFAALDAQTRELMQEELKRIWRETSKTIFFITHSIDEALFLGTRTLVMTARPGRIKCVVESDFADETAHTVSSSASFVAARRRIIEALREESQRAMLEDDAA